MVSITWSGSFWISEHDLEWPCVCKQMSFSQCWKGHLINIWVFGYNFYGLTPSVMSLEGNLRPQPLMYWPCYCSVNTSGPWSEISCNDLTLHQLGVWMTLELSKGYVSVSLFPRNMQPYFRIGGTYLIIIMYDIHKNVNGKSLKKKKVIQRGCS